MRFRVLLIYPPGSQNEKGEQSLREREGDSLFVPYGLLTVAAHLRMHGFDADVVNLTTYPWQDAIEMIRNRPAELYGVSCHTFDRHGAAGLGAEIKALCPGSHLTVGGPHVSALPREWLSHYPAYDSVVIGEGEATALELAERLRDARPTEAIPGTAYRANGSTALGPAREPIADLDTIGKTWEHFGFPMPVTSRGCPGRCTFCCTPKIWGRKIRFRSAHSVLEEIETMVGRHGYPMLWFKDDTFTANKKRLLAICQGILQRGLEFRWTCDTRVDYAAPDVLAAMRRAGCTRISLGVESGSPEILANIGKRTNVDQIAKATAAARELGIDVRFYLMMGNRGETPDTIRQTLALIEKLRPTHFQFAPLCINPGTVEFEHARQRGLLSVEDFFARTNSTFAFNLGESSEAMNQTLQHLSVNLGRREQCYAPYSTADREEILRRHPNMLLSYEDLARSYCCEGRFEDAHGVLCSAAATLGGETPMLMHRLACVHFARRDFAASQRYFDRAWKASPHNQLLKGNVERLNAAGPMDRPQQAEMTRTLLQNLEAESRIAAGQPTFPTPPPACV